MEYSAPVALGSWRERVRRLSVPRARLEDNELVERTRAGDVRSYEELVRRYERLVGRVIYPYAGSEVAVEDLVQETFLRAYDRLSTFNPEYRFKTWLLTIANNLGIDTLRRRRVAVQADRASSVRDAVMALPETYSVPLVLRYAEGLTYAEISEVLGITVPALKSRLFRARNMLAGRLEEKGEAG
jgi:RNA polymerase sigma-70 factor (ECF subfamily)